LDLIRTEGSKVQVIPLPSPSPSPPLSLPPVSTTVIDLIAMKKIHKEVPYNSGLSVQPVAALMALVYSKHPENSVISFIPRTITYLLKDTVFSSSLQPRLNDVVLFHLTHS
jgi:hypothetical protein